MEENIIGGVSPLKKGKWTGRRGKRGGTVGDTRYKRDKWVKPTSGGTTVKAPSAPNPKKPYTMTPDGKVQMTPPGDTYNYGDNIINQTGGGPSSETITTTEPGTDDVWGKKEVTKVKPYSKEWDIEAAGGLTYAEWIKKPGNKEQEKKFVDSQKYTVLEDFLISKGTKPKTTTTKNTKDGGGNNRATINQTINKEDVETSPNAMLGAVGKYRLGGYRAMKKNKK